MIEPQRFIPLTSGVGVAVVVGGCRQHDARPVRDRRSTVCSVGVPFCDVAALIGQCDDGVLLAAVIVTHDLCSCRAAFAVRFAGCAEGAERVSATTIWFRKCESTFLIRARVRAMAC